ncbi:MAG: chromate transporter [Burkholderiaceae bacterium]|jgi:chromate transporter|nr:chromate transporter [Burkholderiaceae bacterium]
MTAALDQATLLLPLFGHFLVLSLLAVGGAITIAPDLHRVMVNELGLLDDAQFASSIAIAQAAPGPNVLFVAVLGYQAAGLPGALTTLIAMMLPSTTLALAAGRWGHARADLLAVQAFKAGMAPVVIALLAATGWILVAETPGRLHIALTIAAALAVWLTRIHLLALIAAGAVIGALGWV